eukprot:543783_1
MSNTKDKHQKNSPPPLTKPIPSPNTTISSQPSNSSTTCTPKPQINPCNTKNTNTTSSNNSTKISSLPSTLNTTTNQIHTNNHNNNTNTNNNNNKISGNEIISLITPNPSHIDNNTYKNSIEFTNGNHSHPTSATNMDINNGSLVRIPSNINNLVSKFGRPSTMSEFNMMAIAGVLQSGNHIHKNRELKSMVKRFKEQVTDQQSQIKILNEKVKIYKDEAEKYERLEIKYNEVMQQNANLLSHTIASKKENTKLKEKIK